MVKTKTRIKAVLICMMMVLSLSGCVPADALERVQISVQNVQNSIEGIHKSVQDVQAGTQEPGEICIDEILSKMTIEEKIDQMMFVSYRTWKEVPEAEGTNAVQTVENQEGDDPAANITELNDEIRADLKEHHYGGVVLFGQNFRDARQTINLISDIQQTNLSGGGLPLFVAADQEGGFVNRISFGTAGIGNMALGATGDADNARSMAAVYGEELMLLGLNTDFAPVVDVNNNPNNPIIGIRSFSDSAEMVSEYGVKYVEGLHDAGAIATLKHFPGHGDTDTDSHTGLPCITSSYEELKQCELIPFKKAIHAGADMVMTVHIQYPKIETGTYTSVSNGEPVYLPATMSSRILTDILRNDMGFEGVIVSDALEMEAISEHFRMEDVLGMTINAGVDMLIVPAVYDSKGLKELDALTDMAVRLYKEGRIDEDRINASVKRILTLKEKYGILSLADFTVTDEAVEKADIGVGSTGNRATAHDLAEKALTLVKNEEAFPIKAGERQSIMILFADTSASRAGAGEMAKQELLSRGLIKDEAQITVMVNDKENGKVCVEEAVKADHCILVYRAYNANCLDPETEDGFSTAVFDSIIEKRHAGDKKTVFISCQLPYDAARFQAADAILITYNSSVMREIPPASGEGSAYAPNLEAALMACFGGSDISGRLPVNIPALDENYQMTDEILYERGEGCLCLQGARK